MSEIARQKVLLHSQNIINYPEFLIGHPSFWHNEIYEPSYFFNKNEC